MFGKGKMYKDSEKMMRENSSLLFPESEEAAVAAVETVEIPLVEAQEESYTNTSDVIETITLDNTVQQAVKQRKVSKIIVLFDDGSFQEM